MWRCGAKLSEDAEKCPVCGTYVNEHFVSQQGDTPGVDFLWMQTDDTVVQITDTDVLSASDVAERSENEYVPVQHATKFFNQIQMERTHHGLSKLKIYFMSLEYEEDGSMI